MNRYPCRYYMQLRNAFKVITFLEKSEEYPLPTEPLLQGDFEAVREYIHTHRVDHTLFDQGTLCQVNERDGDLSIAQWVVVDSATVRFLYDHHVVLK